MSTSEATRLSAPGASDPLRAKWVYYMYHGLRAIRQDLAEEAYDCADDLEEFFEQPVLPPAVLAAVYPRVESWVLRLEEIPREREQCARTMAWLAGEYGRIIAEDCKKNKPFCLIWHCPKALLLTLMAIVLAQFS
jgi:hypothetical protein